VLSWQYVGAVQAWFKPSDLSFRGGTWRSSGETFRVVVSCCMPFIDWKGFNATVNIALNGTPEVSCGLRPAAKLTHRPAVFVF
jgi:hypothetical protein